MFDVHFYIMTMPNISALPDRTPQLSSPLGLLSQILINPFFGGKLLSWPAPDHFMSFFTTFEIFSFLSSYNNQQL